MRERNRDRKRHTESQGEPETGKGGGEWVERITIVPGY